MVIAAGEPRALGGDEPRVRVAEQPKDAAAWRGRRLLFVNDEPAFDLSFWCGTCQFLFRRLEGQRTTFSLEQLGQRLADGLDDLDEEVITTFDALLPRGEYLPLLLSIQPRLVMPGRSGGGDYFTEEQIETWGYDWDGLPIYPATPYYRTFETAVAKDAHLYEFVVPMQPLTWNERPEVEAYVSRLATSSTPTAVAVSALDICAPAVAPEGSDWYEHWGLTHFLLDGHHKMEAAAMAQRPIRLLSLLSIDAGLSQISQCIRIPELRAQQATKRLADATTSNT